MPVTGGLIAALCLATVAGAAAPIAMLVAWWRRRNRAKNNTGFDPKLVPGGKRKTSDPLVSVISTGSLPSEVQNAPIDDKGKFERKMKVRPDDLVMQEQTLQAVDANTYGSMEQRVGDSDSSSATTPFLDGAYSAPENAEVSTPRGTRPPPLQQIQKDALGSGGSTGSIEWDSFEYPNGSRPETPSTPASTSGSIRRKTRMTKQTSVTTYKRSARGSVKVTKVDPSGRFVTVENTGKVTEYLGHWTLRRVVDGNDDIKSFQFPADFSLAPESEVKVCSAGYHDFTAGTDFQLETGNWGAGPQVVTQLLNPTGKVMAALKQCTDTKKEPAVETND